MKNSKFDNIVVAITLIAVIFILIKVGLNLFGIIFSVVALMIGGGVIQGNEENKANQYLARKLDEENEKYK